jgi:hypothetical protein
MLWGKWWYYNCPSVHRLEDRAVDGYEYEWMDVSCFYFDIKIYT